MKRSLILLPLAFLTVACQDGNPTVLLDGPQFAKLALETQDLSPQEALGKALYFDARLSLHRNQSCASCHDPDFGFTGGNPGINLRGSVYPGSVKYLFGGRKPPTAAYATTSPTFDWVDDEGEKIPVGGNFWDGRASGEKLGNPAADQAVGPFLNPVEQALPHAACVIYRVAEGPYADLWVAAGYDPLPTGFPVKLDKMCRDAEAGPAIEAALGGGVEAIMMAFGDVGRAIAAFEGSPEVNAFTSKFDAVMEGRAEFTPGEAWGFDLFEDEDKGNCAACHPTEPGPFHAKALFTDYTYDNLGIPANPLNPAYPAVDIGLGEFEGPDFDGSVKVPTLRNVAKVPGKAPKAYGHNGVFKSLEQIVHFYSTRDVKPTCTTMPATTADLMAMGADCWPPPEVADNVNSDELGDLGLTPAEEAAIVAFMRTLSDGWTGR